MKLSNIKRKGRFENKTTNQIVNIFEGRNCKRGTDHLFFYYRMKRKYISMADFYSANNWHPYN